MSGDWLDDMWDGSGSADSNLTEVDPLSNLTLLSCAVRSIRNTRVLPYSPALTTTVRSFQIIFYIIICTLGITLNSLVIVLVAKYRKLQTLSFGIALQVVVLDSILSSTVLLLRPITSIAKGWLFGEHMCIITAYIYLTYLLLRTLLMFEFVIDRFLSVFFPYSYPKHSVKVMVVLSIGIWVFSIAVRIIPGYLDCYAYVSTSYLCVQSARCGPSCIAAANANLGFVFGPATVTPIILFGILYWKARRIQKKMVAVTGGGDSGGDVRKREWKATITFFLLFVAVFALTTPVIFTNILLATISRKIGPSPVIFVVRSLLSMMTSFLVVADPIVIMRNKDVKEIISKIYAEFITKLRST